MQKKILLILSYLIIQAWNTTISALSLNRVILACDANQNYIHFWPIVAKAWQEIVGIRPTLALIASDDIKVDEHLGDVIRFPPLKNVSTVLYAQCIRLLLPALFPDDICIISDIDMIPLQKKYFIDSIKNIPDDHIAIYRSKTLLKYKQFPMCYVAAKGSVFAEIFNVHSKSDIPLIIWQWAQKLSAWDTDQQLLYQYIITWNKFTSHCVLLDVPVNRIDRARGGYNQEKLDTGSYTDFHCPRPYNKFKTTIDAILRAVIKRERNS